MIKGKRVLAVVSAAGGCKTLRGRYTRQLVSKPLSQWTIEAAKKSRLIDRIVVVTDHSEVRSLAQALGLSVLTVLNQNENSLDRLAHSALTGSNETSGFDFVVVLDGASPLLLGSDIDGVLEISARNDGTPVVIVTETRLSPRSLVVLDGSRRMHRVFGNLDPAPTNSRIYATNSSIAASEISYLKAHETFLTEDSHAFIMPVERSLIVETKTDLMVAESFLRLTGPDNFSFKQTQEISQPRL